MSRGLASRDSQATHRSRAVDTGCLRMGARESPTSGFASRLWRLAGGAEPQCSCPCSGDPVVPSRRGGVRQCARVPGWHVGASPIVTGATEGIVTISSPTSSTGMWVLGSGVAGYKARPSRGNPPGAKGSLGCS